MSSIKMTALISTVLVTSALALLVGASEISTHQVWNTLLSGGEFDFIINQYRLPRVLLALAVGSGLGIAGVLVQGVIRNPLASPDLMGVSAGAGLAATSLIMFKPDASLFLLSVSSMGGGILAAVLIFLVVIKSNPTASRLALIGIAISAFLNCIKHLVFSFLRHRPISYGTSVKWLCI